MIINQNDKRDIFYVSESDLNMPSNPVLDAKADIENIAIGNFNGNYYIEANDLYDHMRASGVYSVKEALNGIIEYYNDYDIDASNIVVIANENDILYDDLQEANVIIQERSSYSDASSVQKEMRWYKKFVSNMKKNPQNKRDIDDRIKLLELCVSQMKKARERGDIGERVKYSLKSLIPLNSIVRFLKDRDNMAGFTWAAGLVAQLALNAAKISAGGVVTAINVGGRFAAYNTMLDSYIKSTQEAIDFLKERKKELE